MAFSNPFEVSTFLSVFFATYHWTFVDTNNSDRVLVNLTLCLPYLPHHPGVIDANLYRIPLPMTKDHGHRKRDPGRELPSISFRLPSSASAVIHTLMKGQLSAPLHQLCPRSAAAHFAPWGPCSCNLTSFYGRTAQFCWKEHHPHFGSISYYGWMWIILWSSLLSPPLIRHAITKDATHGRSVEEAIASLQHFQKSGVSETRGQPLFRVYGAASTPGCCAQPRSNGDTTNNLRKDNRPIDISPRRHFDSVRFRRPAPIFSWCGCSKRAHFKPEYIVEYERSTLREFHLDIFYEPKL